MRRCGQVSGGGRLRQRRVFTGREERDGAEPPRASRSPAGERAARLPPARGNGAREALGAAALPRPRAAAALTCLPRGPPGWVRTSPGDRGARLCLPRGPGGRHAAGGAGRRALLRFA